MEIRELGPADADFLGEMLYEALFWTPAKERLPRAFVLAHPEPGDGLGRMLLQL